MYCPECNVAPGSWHKAGCGWEQCPYCGEHLADCLCSGDLPPLDDRIQWSGACTWLQACLDFGYFEREERGMWRPCRPDEPCAQPDISRLMRECSWSRFDKRFVPALLRERQRRRELPRDGA